MVVHASAGALAAAALALVLAPSAEGATLTSAGGTLTYSANAGHQNQVSFDEGPAGVVRVRRFAFAGGDDDPISATGCTPIVAGDDYTCIAVTRLVADAGDGDDILDAAGINRASTGLTAARAELSGGSGSDELDGGAQGDTLNGGAGDDTLTGGNGDDALNGEAGDDRLFGGAGADTYSGGTGFDFAEFLAGGAPPPSLRVTLDDVADDGVPGENDNVRSDMEDISADTFNAGPPGTPAGAVTLTGTAATNSLTVLAGSATITGGDGNDALTGGPDDDRIEAVDGFADRIKCGGGTDLVKADVFDIVAEDCEGVQLTPGEYKTEDHAPTLTWVTPGAGVRLPGNTPTTLEVSASDDKGISKVQFFADDRLLCEDASAPFTCVDQPRGEDVGRNTFVAVAIDSAQQTASAIRAVVVDRFVPASLSITVTPRRDRTVPYSFRTTGRLALPSQVSQALGCGEGFVSVQIKAGQKTVSNRRAELTKSCTYTLRVSFRDRRRFARDGKLRFTARFTGNDTLQPARSTTRQVDTR